MAEQWEWHRIHLEPTHFQVANQGNSLTKLMSSRDPAKKDYTLADNSPAWALGIEQIDMAIGPRGDVMSTK